MIKKREEFREKQHQTSSRRIIALDETGFHPGMGPRRGRSLRGKPLFGPEAAYSNRQRLSVIGAMSPEGVICTKVVEGGVKQTSFNEFIDALVPFLKPGDVVLMDNLNLHRNAEVVQKVEAANATVCYLPPYSPDMNPIEACWSKLKHIVRKTFARSVEQLKAAIDSSWSHISASDAQGWFGYCGFQIPSESKGSPH